MRTFFFTLMIVALVVPVAHAADPSVLHTFKGHTDWVESVAFSPNGRTIASGSADKTLKVWDVNTGREIRTLTGHTRRVESVAFSPDGSILASGSQDDTVKFWDVNTGREIRTLKGHAFDVTSVAFSPDGQTLASGSNDYTVKLWDVNTGREIRTLKGHSDNVTSVAFSSDGQTLASGSGGWDDTVRLWDVNTGRAIRTLRGQPNDVAFSPDGRTLASASLDIIKLWDVATGREIRTLTGHTRGVYSVSFSPDGNTLASGGSDNTLKLWDVNTGREIRTLTGHTDYVTSVAFSPNGKTLASGSWDSTVVLWALESDTPEPPTGTRVSLSASPAQSPGVGQQITVSVNIANGAKVSGYQATVSYDTTALRYVESANGDYLPQGAFFVPAVASGNKVTLAATSLSGESNGAGKLATITFEVVAVKTSTLDLSNVLLTDGSGKSSTPQTAGTQISSTRVNTQNPPTGTRVSLSASPAQSPGVGQQVTVSVNIANGTKVSGYQATVSYDTTALRYVSSANGDYLPQGAFFVPAVASGNKVTLAATSLSGESNGAGKLATITFEVVAVKTSTLSLSNVLLTDGSGKSSTPETAGTQISSTRVSTPEPSTGPRVSLSASPAQSPGVGQQVTVSVNIANGAKVFGYQATVSFDTTALRYVSSANGDYFPDGSYFDSTVVSGNKVTLASVSLTGEINGAGTLATITFEVVAVKTSTLGLSDVLLADSNSEGSIPETAGTQITHTGRNTPTGTTVSLLASPAQSPGVGQQVTVSVNIANGAKVSGYQATVSYDTTALRYVESANGDYLPQGAFFVPGVASGNKVTLAATSLAGESNGAGKLATITFEVVAVKTSTLGLSNVLLTDGTGKSSTPETAGTQISSTRVSTPEPSTGPRVSLSASPAQSPGVGQQITISVNIANGAKVSGYQATVSFDTTALRYVESANGDYLPDGAFFVPGVVSGNKVTLAATSLSGESNGGGKLATITFEVAAVKASTLGLSNVLLTDGTGKSSTPQTAGTQITALLPQAIALLPNFPNPFNPETWLPYQLSAPADVTISIYAADGQLVRTLALGHQPAGTYHSRSRAAYWDGKNALGEPVASGLYFYTLTAGEFTQTRKMLIRK